MQLAMINLDNLSIGCVYNITYSILTYQKTLTLKCVSVNKSTAVLELFEKANSVYWLYINKNFNTVSKCEETIKDDGSCIVKKQLRRRRKLYSSKL